MCRVSGQLMEFGVLVGWYWQKAEVLEEKPYPSAALSTTDPTRTGLASYPGLSHDLYINIK